MNKRIEALLEQARTKDYWSEGRYLVDFINQEKFAQSIIRECAKIADLADENKCECIGGNILTHFGVKE